MALSYSIPGAAFAMGDGRCYISFENPNGSLSRYFSNWSVDDLIKVDPNFVNPSAQIWDQAQSMCTAPLQALKDQQNWAAEQSRLQAEAIAKIAALTAAEQASFNKDTNAINDPNAVATSTVVITENGVQRISNVSSIQGGGTSDASSKNTPGSATGNMIPTIFDGFTTGLKSILSPGSWMDIISSGNVGAIAGLVAVPIVALSLVKGSKHHGR